MSYTFQHSQVETIPLFDTTNVRTMEEMFYGCPNLKTIPQMNTAKVTNMRRMFAYSPNLVDVPILETKNVTGTGMREMFYSCSLLSDESLNNIMTMCLNAVKITTSTYKKLSYIGISGTALERCKELENYQSLLNAGWTL